MSGGRVELGLGTGWFGAEHAAYGIPFPGLAERFERLEEQLEIITGLWETPEGETFSFDGSSTTRLTDSPALPKPVQRPRPPVLVGGTGRAGHRGWRRGSPTSSTSLSSASEETGCRVRPGPGCLRGGGPGPGLAGVLGRAGGVLRPDRRGDWRGGRRRSAARWPNCEAAGWPGSPARDRWASCGDFARHRRDPDVPAGPRPPRPRPPGTARGRGACPMSADERGTAEVLLMPGGTGSASRGGLSRQRRQRRGERVEDGRVGRQRQVHDRQVGPGVPVGRGQLRGLADRRRCPRPGCSPSR